MPIKLKILDYEFNFRMKWKYKWHDRPWEKGDYWDEMDGFYRVLYSDDFLEQLLADCRKYKCKKKFQDKSKIIKRKGGVV